jgi:uncharacterized protein YkwD
MPVPRPLAALLGSLLSAALLAQSGAADGAERAFAALEARVDAQRKALDHDELLTAYRELEAGLRGTTLAARATQRIALLSIEKTLLEKAGALAALRERPAEAVVAALAAGPNTAEEELALARFCLLCERTGAFEDALARARDGDPDLKSETDRLLAQARGEPVPRGGYHRYRGAWLALDERDRRQALDAAREQLAALGIDGARLPTDAEPAPDALRAAAARVRESLAADYDAVRGWLPSYARQDALRRQILAHLAALAPPRKTALELLARYDKAEQGEVDALRAQLEKGWQEYLRLRERDRITWERTSERDARALVQRIEAREAALAAAHRFLEKFAPPGLPAAAIAPAHGADVASRHVLPGREQSGLEDVLWLLARQRAGMILDALARASELLRQPEALTPYEAYLAQDIRDTAIETLNERMALSLDVEERRFAQRLNDYRRALGLAPFELEERLDVAARKHSQEMVDLGYFGHISPVARNRSPSDRVRLEGYSGGVGENCLAGQVDGVGAFEGWYRSPGHHRNLVSGGIHLGVGATGDHAMWTMVCGGADLTWRNLHRDLAPEERDRFAALAERLAGALRAPPGNDAARAAVAGLLREANAALPDLLPFVARIAFAAANAPRDPAHAAVPALLDVIAQAEVGPDWRPLQIAAIAAAIDYLGAGASLEGRRQAQRLVERHAGRSLAYDPLGADAARRDAARALRRHWEDDAQWRFRRADAPPPTAAAIPGRIGDGPSLKAPLKALTRRQRLSLAKRFGGGSPTEQAVDRGLAFLARVQDDDGGWRARSFLLRSPRFDARTGGPGNAEWEVAMTGLALLAFASAGHTPSQGDHADAVRRGAAFLLQRIVDYGRFETTSTHYMYTHAIATQALCELYSLTADPHIGTGAQLAVDFLMFAQHEESGGWRYEANERADTSVTGWVVLALHAAHKARLDVAGFRGAQQFFDSVTAPGYYMVGYMSPTDHGTQNPRLASVGMVSRLFLGGRKDDPRVVLHAWRLRNNTPTPADPDFYHWYYATLGMFQVGGAFWNAWNEGLKSTLLALQDADQESPYAGSWPPDRHHGGTGGRLYATALGVLMLTTYYRYDREAKTKVVPFTGDLRAAVAPYLEAMRTATDDRQRDLAGMKLLDELGTSSAPTLIGMAADPQAERNLRRFAAGLLAQACEPRHEAALHELLTANDHVVVERAMRALASVASVQSVPLLCRQLDHGDRDVRAFAARTLGRLGDAQAVAPLGARLEREGDRWCQDEMRAALRRLAHRRSMTVIVKAAIGADAAGLLAVLDGLDLLDQNGLAERIAALEGPEARLYRRVLEAVARHRQGAAVPVLLALLESDNLETRAEAFKLLVALTGRGFDYAAEADPSARAAALARWQGWWREHVGEFVLEHGK